MNQTGQLEILEYQGKEFLKCIIPKDRILTIYLNQAVNFIKQLFKFLAEFHLALAEIQSGKLGYKLTILPINVLPKRSIQLCLFDKER